MRIFFSAGEASGDAYAAALVQRLRGQGDFVFEGVGGKRLAAEGVALTADATHWGALGIAQSLLVVPRVSTGFRSALRRLRAGPPGVLVPIDFGYMNIRLSKRARTMGWRVVYFIPPGSWRRDRQGRDLPQIADAIVTPFPWSAEILRDMGANAHWFGHPLREMVTSALPCPPPREPSRLAVLPGSRLHEIEQNLPVIAKAVGQVPEVKVIEFAASSTVDPNALRESWSRHRPTHEFTVTSGDTYGVLARAWAGIICSGTATLEAALCGCPCVVMYRGTPMMRLEYRIVRPKFDHIALPNILLGERVLPELIDTDANATRIATALRDVWSGTGRARQAEAFARLDTMLGPEDAVTQAAKLIAHVASNA